VYVVIKVEFSIKVEAQIVPNGLRRENGASYKGEIDGRVRG